MKHYPTNNGAAITANKGFTLVELMVIVAILAIAATLATPSFIKQMQRSEISRSARDFQLSLEEAKKKAYISGRSYTVCPVDSIDKTTKAEIACKKDWNSFNGTSTANNKGWIVFYDANNNQTVDKGENIISIHTVNSGMVALSWTGNNGIITLTPRNTTGSTGTMRVYAHKNGKLPNWKGHRDTPVSESLLELRVSLSALGRVKLYQ